MRIKEIEARLAAIKQEIEQRGDAMTAAEIDALEQETTQLTEERAGLIAAAEKRNGILDNIAKGAGIVSRSFQQNNGDDNAAPDDPFGTPEYRSAWLKNIRRLPLNDAEKRAFSNASGAGAEVIPTQTANEIISKVKTLAPMLNEVTLLHVKGAVKFAIEGTNNAAAIHTENASITAAADTLTTVSLSGYEIVKLVQISDTVMTMSITAFESWIVNDVFDEYRQVLGAEKIRTILVQRGHQVSTEYISRLMREMGLSSVRSTAKQEYLKLREPERKKNILRQQFNAQRPNQRWVSDVTCFKLGDHYFYICVIIDLFSRKVIAHKISKKNSTQLLTATFKMAHEERHPPSGLIFHSDRGAQYTSHRFQQLLHKYNTKQSFSQPGKPHDNAVAESFFASLKKEELYRKDHPSDRAFQASVASYIEFYNTKRPHRTLKNLTPYQMEENFCATVK